MLRISDCPLIELERSFPDRLFLIALPSHGKYGCYCHKGIHGLACFEYQQAAAWFGAQLDLSGVVIEPVDFDHARLIAKGRGLPIVSVMLCDDLSDPLIHFVR